MLYVCVRGVMDVVFSVCIVTRGAIWKCFVMQMLYVCVLCASCGSSQCCILHASLVEDARGDHMVEAYSRAGLMTAL